jgi:hypothetical protein
VAWESLLAINPGAKSPGGQTVRDLVDHIQRGPPEMKMTKAICNQSTLIRKGRVFDFFTENVTLPNGVAMDMEIIRHPGAAAIVPVMEDHSVTTPQTVSSCGGWFHLGDSGRNDRPG